MTTFELYFMLWGKPAWELDVMEGQGKLTAEMLKTYGVELQKELDLLGYYIKKLEAAGWDQYTGVYSVTFYKQFEDREQAEAERRALGILETVRESDPGEYEDDNKTDSRTR